MGHRGGGPGFVAAVRVAADVDPARWVAARLLPWGADELPGTRVGSVVPTGFRAYARVLHPAFAPGATVPDVSWSRVARATGRVVHAGMQWEAISHGAPDLPFAEPPERGSLPRALAEVLVERLRPFTTAPGRCRHLVWDGYGDLPGGDLERVPRVRHPWRDYVLLSGPVEAAAAPLWQGEGGFARYQSPNLWWPQDRAWFVATEIDFSWTYVAGSAACVDALLREPRLETFTVGPEDRADLFGDDRNPLPAELRERFDEAPSA